MNEIQGTLDFVRTGWACVTDTMCGSYVALEGSTHEDTVPLLFDTQREAEAERQDNIDMVLESRRQDLDADPGELDELLDAERELLDAEEWVCHVGVTREGDVYAVDPGTGAVGEQLMRPDR